MRSIFPILLLSLWKTAATGFLAAGGPPTARRPTSTTPQPRSSSSPWRVLMLPEAMMATVTTASSWWVATIDSDIANIPDNEFAPVFLGGMAVILGGVLSATFVGSVVDQKNLYGQLVADSYNQGNGDKDQEFWKSLSPEETIRVGELLEQVKEGKGGKQELEDFLAQKMAAVSSAAAVSQNDNASKSSDQSQLSSETTPKNQKELSIFSDYAE